MSNQITLLGIGHNSVVYMDLVECLGYEINGLYHYNDDRTGEVYYGHRIQGCFEDLLKNECMVRGRLFVLTMGNNQIRMGLFQKIQSKGGIVPNLIHPTAVISKYAKIGQGVVVHANSVIQAGACLLDNCVVSYNSSVSHNAIINAHSYIAFGATIGAYVEIDENVFVGQGAILISAKVHKVGANSIIGAGAIVTKDVPANVVVAGSPARVIKELG